MKAIKNIQLPIRELRESVSNIADESLLRELTELEEKVASAQSYLVVLGMFKRGKSTLINALLGKEIAPVGVIPLTAIITLFEYATENYAEVIFSNGSAKKIALSAIEDYVTEKNNPQNQKGVRYVKIFDNDPLLRKISLIDTPGLGSEFEHNTQTTLSFIPKIDVALFVMSADTPVSKSDLELLKQMKKSAPKVLYVLNKADLLSPGELNQMEAYNKKAITTALSEEEALSDWFTVSAKCDNHNGHIDLLKQRLIQLSYKDREDILHKSIQQRYKILLSEAKMQIRLQLDALQMPLQELEEKQKKFHESLRLLQNQRSEFDHLMKGGVTQLQQKIDHEVKVCEKRLNDQLQKQLIRNPKQAYDQMQKEGANAFQKNIIDYIIKQFDQTKQSLEQQTRLQFGELLDEYCNRSQSFLKEMATHLHSLLGIDYHQIAEQFDLNTYTAFYLDHGRGDKPVYLKPSFILQKTGNSFLKKKFMKRLYSLHHQLVITNTSGVIYDLQYKIQESFRKFNYDLNDHLHKLLQRIEKVISDTLEERHNQAYSSVHKKKELIHTLEKLNVLKVRGSIN